MSAFCLYDLMDAPRIQYAKTSDGVSIAYADSGAGYPLVFVPAVPRSHVQLAWDVFAYHHQALAERFRFVRYDPRGCGLSERHPQTDFSLAAMLRDFDAVVDKLGLKQFAVWSNTYGVPVALAATAARAESVSHVVLCDGWACHSQYPETVAFRAGEAVRAIDWEVYTETFGRGLAGFDDELAGRYGAFLRACCDGPGFARANAAALAYDVRHLLPAVTAPTLVVHTLGHPRVARAGRPRSGDRPPAQRAAPQR